MRQTRLVFEYVVKPKRKQREIIDEMMWHCAKVYNTFNYELQEKKESFHVKGNLNVESSKIYKKYRKNNWHSEYLHSHMLQEILLNVMSDYKSYKMLEEAYEKGNKEIKGKPRIARYKKAEKVQITFTKYAVRQEKNMIKIRKQGKEKYSLYKKYDKAIIIKKDARKV